MLQNIKQLVYIAITIILKMKFISGTLCDTTYKVNIFIRL